jgi:hypothetical protein
MRIGAVLLLVASGCSYYFGSPRDRGDDGPPDAATRPDAHRPPDAGIPPDAYPPPDASIPPDAAQMTATQARCEDGVLRGVEIPVGVWSPDSPGHGEGRVLGHCATATCRSAAVMCTSSTCAEGIDTLCSAPISIGATCSLDGTACQGTGSIDCPVVPGCGDPQPGSTCSCANGRYQCAQVTRAAEVQAALVGKWHGTVTPPFFASPYPISMWIYPDGTYWAECTQPNCTALYYGGDGPSPARRITVLSTAALVGAWADIAVDFSFNDVTRGTLDALTIDASTLRFTFWDSWSGCVRPFSVTLSRD